MKLIMCTLFLFASVLLPRAVAQPPPPERPPCDPSSGDIFPIDGDIPCSVVHCAPGGVSTAMFQIPVGSHSTMHPINYYFPMWTALDLQDTASDGTFETKKIMRMTGTLSSLWSDKPIENVVVARMESHYKNQYFMDFYLMNPAFYEYQGIGTAPPREILVGSIPVGINGAHEQVFEIKVKNNRSEIVLRAWDNQLNTTKMTADYPLGFHQIDDVLVTINEYPGPCLNNPQPYDISTHPAHTDNSSFITTH